jgi:hypothetical protein
MDCQDAAMIEICVLPHGEGGEGILVGYMQVSCINLRAAFFKLLEEKLM